MRKITTENPVEATPEASAGVLETLIRTGARQVLQAALEAEIQEHLDRYKAFVDGNGWLPRSCRSGKHHILPLADGGQPRK